MEIILIKPYKYYRVKSYFIQGKLHTPAFTGLGVSFEVHHKKLYCRPGL